MKLLRDTWLIFARQMGLTLRQPVWVVVMLSQPLFFLVLFGPLLKPLFGADAYKIFVPALLVMLAMFSTLFVGFGLIAELRAGVIERMRVTPVSRLALLLGRAGRDIAVLLFQAVVLVVLAIPFGLSVRVGPLLLTLALLALIGLLCTSLSYAVSLILRSEDALAPLANGVSQPLLLLSGILLPLSLAPQWLQTVAKFNPFSWAVEASKALFAGDLSDDSIWQSGIILGVLAALAVVWSARQFARSVR
jgi:ABC-2 type transport system permease protein